MKEKRLPRRYRRTKVDKFFRWPWVETMTYLEDFDLDAKGFTIVVLRRLVIEIGWFGR